MMNLSREKEKKVLVAMLAILALLIVYRIVTAEKPKTAPLAFPHGSVAHSAVRQGLASTASADPLNIFLAKQEEKFPGVSRDIFRMENPAPKPKPKSEPPPPVKTPEELAAEAARTAAEQAAAAVRAAEEAARVELSKFRFLGYLTERESKLFLSKDGELFIVKRGDTVLRSYKVKEAGKDYVVLLDTATHVEARVELSGGESQQQQPPQQFLQRPQPQPMQPFPPQPMQPQMQRPTQQPQQKTP